MLTVMRGAEARLVETLGEIGPGAESWVCVVFHLQNLLEQYKSDYQTRIAVNLIHDLVSEYEGGIFVFADGGIAVLTNHLSASLLSKLVFQLRYLYMDDPLAYGEDGTENPAFHTVYRLGMEWQACSDYAARRMTQAARGLRESPAAGVNRHFSVAKLVSVERDLAELDISPAVRAQPICAVAGNGTIRKVFDELYIYMPHLRELLKVEAELASNRWLFKYMTQLLDQRVLQLIQANLKQYMATPVSININVEALLSEGFAAFDAALKPEQKVSMVLEISAVDVFADIRAYLLARDTVQKQGYRVCIDGLTADSLQMINRERLGADLLKLQWNADAATDLKSPANRALMQSIAQSGHSRIILCRCDSRAAVDYGLAMSLSLFQGRYIDQLINPAAKVSN